MLAGTTIMTANKMSLFEQYEALYRHGQCWRLAAALARVTGWCVVELSSQQDINDAFHVVCQAPGGLVDIRGYVTLAQLEEYYDRPLYPFEGAEATGAHHKNDELPLDVAHALLEQLS